MQSEINKIANFLLNPPKNGKLPSSKKPHELKRPGSPATAGWVITAFGHLCLDYLDDVEVNIAASDALQAGEDQPPTRD